MMHRRLITLQQKSEPDIGFGFHFEARGNVVLHVGDALSVLRTLQDRSHQMCVTSPPYYGLRDYGTGEWVGGDPNCKHEKPITPQRDSPSKPNSTRGQMKWSAGQYEQFKYGRVCAKCGAQRVDHQIGLEDTPEEYVANLVEIFREVKRILRDDGTLWLNIGDSYATAPAGNKDGFKKSSLGNNTEYKLMRQRGGTDKTKLPNIKQKDMIGVPWMLAFALRADGWYLRKDIIWHKPFGMPESVTDRPTSSYEHVFLLAKSKDYFFDDDAIAEPDKTQSSSRGPEPTWNYGPMNGGNEGLRKRDQSYHYVDEQPMRNIRDVWTIPLEPYPGAHFATFPQKLVEPCIKAGSSEIGCCPTCGSPYDRISKKQPLDPNDAPTMSAIANAGGDDYGTYSGTSRKGHTEHGVQDSSSGKASILRSIRRKEHEWRPTCTCPPQSPVPCWVLDPFGGSGTTGLVAAMGGVPMGEPRNATLIELNPKYAEMAEKRIKTESHGYVKVFVE